MKTILNLLISRIFRTIVGTPGWSAGWRPALVRIKPSYTCLYRAVPANDFRPRQTSRRPPPRSGAAFTLIELLVVIAIIGILAAMLFPAIGKAKIAAQKGTAKADMSNLGMAIKSYESDYNGRLPAPGIPTGVQDVTYGYNANPLTGHYTLPDNRDVIAVLLNLETFPDGTPTTNKGKIYNARGLTPFNAKYAKDVNSAGIGPDGNYRDPWGNLYVISMDTSLNERCRDNFYSRQSVSQDNLQKGHYGLSNPNNATGASDEYEYAGQYLIWSFGPDKQVDPATKANTGVNKDNVLSWQ